MKKLETIHQTYSLTTGVFLAGAVAGCEYSAIAAAMTAAVYALNLRQVAGSWRGIFAGAQPASVKS